MVYIAYLSFQSSQVHWKSCILEMTVGNTRSLLPNTSASHVSRRGYNYAPMSQTHCFLSTVYAAYQGEATIPGDGNKTNNNHFREQSKPLVDYIYIT